MILFELYFTASDFKTKLAFASRNMLVVFMFT